MLWRISQSSKTQVKDIINMPNRSLARRRDCRLRGWRLQISANRKRIELKDKTGEVLLEGAKITVESYLDGYFDGLEQTLGNRVPKPKN